MPAPTAESRSQGHRISNRTGRGSLHAGLPGGVGKVAHECGERLLMRLRIGTRALRAVKEHAESIQPVTACGLLIGTQNGDGPWIERSLRCFNAAPDSERIGGFEIDSRVLMNVRRSLAATPSSILGFYYSGSDPQARPTGRDMNLLRLWPGMLLLIRAAGGADAAFRIWTAASADASVHEVSPEIVEPPSAGLLVCPE